MTNPVVCLTSGLLLLAAAAIAQPPPQKVGFAQSLQSAYNQIKTVVTLAADKMPDGDYSSKPSSMPEVRTYGQLFGHIANAQFGQCAQAKGVPNPNQGTNLEQKMTKAEFVKALADSFAFCDDAFSSLTDESAMQMVTGGRGEQTRAAALMGLIAHSNEMYGTAAVYLRAKNLVPPSTENAARGRGGRGRI